jgi:transposase InsO family protein
MSCKVMRVSKSAYYAWRKRPVIIISAQTLNLHRRAKALFEDSRDSLGSRELGKKLRKEDFDVSRHRVIGLMKRLGLVFHSDRGSQYTSKRFRSLLKPLHCRASMGDVGACWDNSVVERFFGSLKHDWLFKVSQPTREHMRQDVAAYVKYYNLERLHSSNGDQSPIEYENSFRKVSGWT